MHPPLQNRTRLAGRIDRLGLYLVILLACIGWFYILFKQIIPAALAGGALSVMVMYTVRLGELQTLARREAALRCRLGGEMAVDSLLLQSPVSAVSNVVAWMSQALNCSNFQPKAHGMLADHEQGRVFITCVQRHASLPTSCDDVLACVRHARRESADICIVCSTSDFSQQATLLAEDLQPRTRLLGRSGLIRLAGVSAPATDEQLSALGKRGRQKFDRGLWQARILDPAKKKRYLLYGLVLSAMYLLTRQFVYAIPGLVCLLLFAFCRRKRAEKFTL